MRWYGTSVLFCSYDSDPPRHSPHLCLKVLRFGTAPRGVRLPSTNGMDSYCSPAILWRAIAVIGMCGGGVRVVEG